MYVSAIVIQGKTSLAWRTASVVEIHCHQVIGDYRSSWREASSAAA